LAHRPPLGEKGVLMVTRSWRTVFALFVHDLQEIE